METLLQDLRYGLRMLGKNPSFTAVAVVTLALGIGATTAIFSLVEAVILRPVPGRDPGRLVAVYTSGPNGAGYSSTSYPDYVYWKDHARSFSGMFAYARIRLSWSNGDQPDETWTELVTGNYFAVLGVKPFLGRTFLPHEDQIPGAHPVAVVGYNFWRRRLDANPLAIGTAVTLNGYPFTIVGVAPRDFEGINLDWGAPPDFWLPMAMQAQAMPMAPDLLHMREARWLLAFGRLKPAVTISQTRAELGLLGRQLAEAFPVTDKGRTAIVLPGGEGRFWPGFRQEVVHFLSLLAVAVGFVLLIACSNVANLLLARGATRHKEIGVRLALGASRARVIRQLLTESLLLALGGGAAGLWVALVVMNWLPRFRLPFRIPMALHLSLDGRVLLFATAVSLLTMFLSGMVPAVQASKSNLNESLKEGAHRASAGRAGQRLRQALIVCEVALTVVALIAAGLLLTSLRRLELVDPGFDPHHVLAVGLDLYTRKYSASDGIRFYKELVERLSARPGVRSVTLVNDLPLSMVRGHTHVIIDGDDGKAPKGCFEIQDNVIAPDYFRTLKIPLLRGREFSTRDDRFATPVVIINRTMAEHFWPGQDPLGRRIRFVPGSVDREVIGVADDIKYHTLWENPEPFLYIALYQNYLPAPTLLVRTAASPMSSAGVVRHEIEALDKQVPTTGITTLEQQAEDSVSQPRMAAALLSAFGLLALILAAAGIYGVLAYWVTERTHEMGIRMALGAQKSDVLRLVVWEGFRLALIGVGFGFVGALALTRFLSSLLYGVKPTDPLTFIIVSLGLTGVAVLASYIPARRATKVDPMVALRYE